MPEARNMENSINFSNEERVNKHERSFLQKSFLDIAAGMVNETEALNAAEVSTFFFNYF